MVHRVDLTDAVKLDPVQDSVQDSVEADQKGRSRSKASQKKQSKSYVDSSSVVGRVPSKKRGKIVGDDEVVERTIGDLRKFQSTKNRPTSDPTNSKKKKSMIRKPSSMSVQSDHRYQRTYAKSDWDLYSKTKSTEQIGESSPPSIKDTAFSNSQYLLDRTVLSRTTLKSAVQENIADFSGSKLLKRSRVSFHEDPSIPPSSDSNDFDPLLENRSYQSQEMLFSNDREPPREGHW